MNEERFFEPFQDKATGKYGFKNRETGETVIAPKYDIIGRPYFYIEDTDNEYAESSLQYDGFFDGLCLAGIISVKREKWYQSSHKYGYIDLAGNEVIPLIYDDATWFEGGMAAVKSDGKWGFIDKTGTTCIPFQYDEAESFWKGLALVCRNNRWGVIDTSGKAVIPLEYEYDNLSILYNCSEFYAEDLLYRGEVLIKVEKPVFFNRKGEKTEPPVKIEKLCCIEDEDREWRPGDKVYRLIKTENGHYGIYDEDEDKYVFEPKYDDISSFGNGRVKIKLGDEAFEIDLQAGI